ncbi:MAG: hypothetical protein HQL73_00260 [Magnetococcales bacterium]|nr:hypothetical protein [Magnetococcales bacterium]
MHDSFPGVVIVNASLRKVGIRYKYFVKAGNDDRFSTIGRKMGYSQIGGYVLLWWWVELEVPLFVIGGAEWFQEQL